jgi:uncharacterized protein YidB (DUF937 family)
MLDQLINLVKEHAGEAIINNSAIPNKHNDAAIKETASGILNGLKGQLSGGNLGSITDLLKGGNMSGNPIVSAITQQVSSRLMKKFGLDNSAASSIVASLIPNVLSSLSKKTNDPNDNSFTMDSIMGALNTGGGILGKLKGMFGK